MRSLKTRVKMYRKRHNLAACPLEQHEREMTIATNEAYAQLMKMFQTESVIPCRSCKQKSVAWTTAQLTSADEITTVLCKCDLCGDEWSFR